MGYRRFRRPHGCCCFLLFVFCCCRCFLQLLLLLLLFHVIAAAVAVAAGVVVAVVFCCCCCCCCCWCCCCWRRFKQTDPKSCQSGGRTRGQRPRPPPGGWSEVGDRNKGAFWAASQKQQNHYFCCTKLQISGWNMISTKHNTDCGTTENRSKSSRIRVKS